MTWNVDFTGVVFILGEHIHTHTQHICYHYYILPVEDTLKELLYVVYIYELVRYNKDLAVCTSHIEKYTVGGWGNYR